MAKVKEEQLPLDVTSDGRKRSKRTTRRYRKVRAIERDRLAKKIQYFEWKTKEIESRKSGNTVTIGTDLLKRIRFPSESVDGEVRTDKPKKKKTVKPNSCDKPIKNKKKRDEKSQKSHQGDSPAVNGGGPTGNQSQNAPFQQAPAFNSGGGGGGMNVGSAGFGGGQRGGYGGGGHGQFGGGGGGGPQFGNGNPMHFFPFQGNRQFCEQSVSEVMQAMQVGFGLGVAAMAQMRTGQESQMTANRGSAGFGDGYGGGVQGGGPQGDQNSWRQ
ncbi:hypothetical protein CRE_21285 [Caenorhabditis remanei]|uniref:Uncharacterized protein n=1 Tax=Caenorhabditis remanei TaxID=31234 RepID=E3MF89_CAERE|nr:hypothetical protein CRE_21285 [Caenorhabditis remanei]